jgi:hypothetical protein
MKQYAGLSNFAAGCLTTGSMKKLLKKAPKVGEPFKRNG